jgi:hypothetical protein
MAGTPQRRFSVCVTSMNDPSAGQEGYVRLNTLQYPYVHLATLTTTR